MRRSNGSSDATACYKILLVAMWDRMPAAKVFMHVAVRTMHDRPNETTKIFRPAQLAPEEQALSARTPFLTLIGCCLHYIFTWPARPSNCAASHVGNSGVIVTTPLVIDGYDACQDDDG
jgi:hypothetical protein